MQAVKQILDERGLSADQMELGDTIEVNGQADMPLTIEKIGEDKISVAHYYTQRGDLMADPEIVFDISDGEWRPVSYTQHPQIYQHDETGLPEVAEFARQWSQNLEAQGFTPNGGGQ